MTVNSLSNNRTFDRSKLKALADDKSKEAQMTKLTFKEQKTLWEKGEILVTSISSFPQNAFKGLYLRVAKTRDCVVPG